MQHWGCCGRERTFRNDIKLKGRKDFFQTSVYRSLLVVFLVVEYKNSFSCLNALTHASGLHGNPLDFVRPATEEHRGLFFFSDPSSAVRLIEEQQRGLHIPVRSACFVWGRLGYIVRGTVVVRKKAINSSCNSRKLSQVVHQLVEQTESDILHVRSRL